MHTGLQASNNVHLQGVKSSECDVCRGDSEINFSSQGCCRDFQVTHDLLPIVSAMGSDIFEERIAKYMESNSLPSIRIPDDLTRYFGYGPQFETCLSDSMTQRYEPFHHVTDNGVAISSAK
jgi:hypothetical protein